MRRIVVLIAMAFLLALPAWAGEGKCTYSTQDCLDHMANMRTAGWVGIEYDKDANSHKLLVKNVLEGSPAAAAGLRAGDLMVALNGVKLEGASDADLKKARAEWKPGQQVQYTVVRDGKSQDLTLTLGSWPADMLAKTVGKHMLEHAASAEVSSK